MADPIAIVGMGAMFPGAPDLATYWRNVETGVDAITEVPASRWEPYFYDADSTAPDRVYCNRGGFVEDPASFDPTAFGIMPVTVEAAEPDQLIALKVAAAAIDDAGGTAGLGDPERVGVIVGRGGYFTPGMARFDQRVRVAQQLVESLRDLVPGIDEDRLQAVKTAFQDQLGPSRPEAAIDLVPNLAASRIANRLDFQGPAFTVDGACASSLLAVDLASRELVSGRCEAVIAGGVHHCHDVAFWAVFSQLRALSPSQQIRPFDRSADGLLIGEGTGMVVLKRLADAEAAGDRVYAVIHATGTASDGRASSVMKPRVAGQLQALHRAYAATDLDPASIGLIEAHGTATPVGDEAELDTLARFFGPANGRTATLGSVKSMIGHAMPAAGVAALIKTALALHHKVLPPTLHCDDPHPRMADTRFATSPVAVPWEDTGDAGVRRAGVNAFGFGGINAHTVLEEWRNGSDTGTTGSWAAAAADPVGEGAGERVVLLAADDARALLEQLDDPAILTVRDDLADPPVGAARLALVDPDERRLELARKVVERGTPWRGRNDVWFTDDGLLTGGGRVAFVFPGVEPVFDPRVADVAERFGLDWDDLPRGEAGPGAAGGATEAHGGLGQHGAGIVALGRMLDATLRELDIRPDLVAGHSIGEWNAMIAAGMIAPDGIDDFIASVDIDEIDVPSVVFAALGCGAADAAEVIDDLEDVVVSHDNCTRQSVVCGTEAAVAVVLDRLADRQVMAQRLPFRSGFHSPMLAPFVEPARRDTERVPLQEPEVPVWSATEVAPYPTDPEAVRDLVIRHLLEPVRFRELVRGLYDDGVRVFVEVGQGSLTGFIDDTLSGDDHITIATVSTRHAGLAQIRRAAVAHWVEGGRPRFDRLVGDRDRAPITPTGATTDHHGPTVPIALGAPLIHLDPSAGVDLGPARPAVHPLGAAGVGDHPVLAEFDELVRDSTTASHDVIEAWRSAGPVPGVTAPPPAATETPSPAPAETAPASYSERRTFSVEDMPFLLDHRFYRQRDDWDDVSDLFPVVPMTCILGILTQVASELMPGRVPIGLDHVRALRWLAAEPPVEVAIDATVIGPDEVRVTIEGYSRGTVRFADGYDPAPTADPTPLEDATVWGPTAWDLYHDRWAFHGPQYQGVREIGPLGESGVQGRIEALAAPGALLDAAGQLVGHWVAMYTEIDRLALPSMIERIRFFAPPPPTGSAFDCTVRVNELTDAIVRADLEIAAPDGRVYARIHNWQDTRFDTDEIVFPVLRDPDTAAIGEPQPGGWVLVRERWGNSASRELMMRRYLNHRERPTYEALNPRAQRAWLLGRVAAKDAVRQWLWAQGAGPVFPAEITVDNDDSGRPTVSGPFEEDLRVSLAHTEWVAAATVEVGIPVGIDIERVEARSERFAGLTLDDAEVAQVDGADDRDLALTLLWSVKEAVAKARGTGLVGRPKAFPVRPTDDGRFAVADQIVDSAVLELDEEARHVVAWTTT